jgi:hypothetical protein
MEASATFALKAGVWFRRGLLLSPVCGRRRRYQAEAPLIDLFKFVRPVLFWAPKLVRLLQANTITFLRNWVLRDKANNAP